jgi:hypothetical protein
VACLVTNEGKIRLVSLQQYQSYVSDTGYVCVVFPDGIIGVVIEGDCSRKIEANDFVNEQFTAIIEFGYRNVICKRQ